MNKTEIKKALYREKPTAFYLKKSKEFAEYRAEISEPEDSVYFKIPLEEASNFDNEIPAQLLIRWLKQ